MKVTVREEIKLYRFHNLSGINEIDHFVTGRQGGYSKGPFESLNTGFHVGDSDWNVLQNRKKLARVLGVDLSQFTLANQTHSRNVAIIDKCKKSKGSAGIETAIENTDALLCNTRGIFICVQVADCVPILLYDPVKHVIGAIHAGWRGTLKKITAFTIRQMADTFESKPSDIIAGIGPSNGPCCYEVGADVKSEAIQSLGITKSILVASETEGKYFFDQWRANYDQLLESGLKAENIEISGICTQTHSVDFFSSRAGSGVTGRFIAGIKLK
jgi:polyphenol oxidase